MSTCPETDIHSIYLDGELPEQFKNEYEQHIANCPECARKLKQLRVVHEIFAADSKSISLTEDELEESYRRLQARLSYRKGLNFKKEENSFGKKIFSISKYAVVGVAAAAAVAFIMPSGSPQVNSYTSFQPVARSAIPSVTSRVKYNSRINALKFGPVLGEKNVAEDMSFGTVANTVNPIMVSNGFDSESFHADFAGYDVFNIPSSHENAMGDSFPASSAVLFDVGK